MSYQGGMAPSNGWAGHGPPNPYAAQDPRSQQRSSMPNGGQPQYQSAVNQGQYWNPNIQAPYGTPPNYMNNGFQVLASAHQQFQQPQQQQQQQPQYISPAQLLQQQPPTQPRMSQQYQRPADMTNGRNVLEPTFNNPPRISPSYTSDPQQDTVMLLVALAEEYFEAAHELAPAVAASMTDTDVHAYEKLIATGLGCLDTALKHVRLPPRLEANIRLRYAAVLYEETENSMEAEIALSKGLALCDRNHYYDLKYAMQFLLAQFMGKKNPKASMKALDGHITEAQAYQHYSWVYVFRFLRATHALESGTLLDIHAAVQNLRAVATLAEQQGDHAIHLTASLMETIAYMKTTGPEAMEHIQTAIAAAWKYQEEPSCKIPQLVGLTHILAVACSIRQGNSTAMLNKLKEMQVMLDEALKDSAWSTASDVVAIPIRRTPKSSQIVSQDTRMILGIGVDGGDNLMMCFLTKKDAYCITYLLSGMVLLHKNSADQKGFKYLKAGLDLLESQTADTSTAKKPPGLLPDLISKRHWRGQLLCYFRVYMAFCSAGLGDWPAAKRYIDGLEATALSFGIPLTGPLGSLSMYLTGAYHQGVGELDSALQIFRSDKFSLSGTKSSGTSLTDQIHRDISLLAALNTLWILQERGRQDFNQNASLMEILKPLCENHPSMDIQTAFNLVAATVPTNTPAAVYSVKGYLRNALSGAKATANTQFLCITLNVMCSRFFSNVVGDQAEKSAMAASTQATNSGNVLWRSVADGMLSRCYQLQGKKELAEKTLQEAQYYGQQAFKGSSSSGGHVNGG